MASPEWSAEAEADMVAACQEYGWAFLELLDLHGGDLEAAGRDLVARVVAVQAAPD